MTRMMTLSRFVRDARAIAAVEFALVMPFAVLLLGGEYTLCEAISLSRKVAITGHSVADLVAKQPSVVASEVQTILNASTQIMSPFSNTNLVIVVAELTTDSSNKTTVTWSQATSNGIKLTAGTTFTMPANIGQASSSIIYASATYTYSPIIGKNIFGTIPISYVFYENPRNTSSVPCSNC